MPNIFISYIDLILNENIVFSAGKCNGAVLSCILIGIGSQCEKFEAHTRVNIECTITRLLVVS